MDIKLSRTAWHYKLQTNVFGFEPTFVNFCPYFWLTIFCVLSFPFILIYRAGKWAATHGYVGVDYAADKVIGFFDVVICGPIDKLMIRLLPDDDILNLYDKSRDYWLERRKDDKSYDERQALQDLVWRNSNMKESKVLRMDARFQRWKSIIGPNWQEYLLVLRKSREEAAERRAHEAKLTELAKIEQEKKRKEIQLKLANGMQKTAPWLLGVLALIVVGLLVRLFAYLARLASALNWALVLKNVGIVLGIVVLAALGIALIVLLVKFVKTMVSKCDLPVGGALRGLSRVFFPFLWAGRHTAKGVGVLVSPFVAFGMFVVEYVKTAKQNYCPKITWEK